MASLLVRLRPSGPWRIGPDSGDRDRVDRIFHSDALYAAVCAAMSRLGWLEEWLSATAQAETPAVRFSSCFPFLGEALYVAPPAHIWPPAASSKVRWKGARFVPIKVVETLLAGRLLNEDAWSVEGESQCLMPQSAPAGSMLFRTSVRSSAAVDRDGSGAAAHSVACIEFTAGSGLWCLCRYASDEGSQTWDARLRAAFRYLADTGFGGERSRGWGRAESPDFRDGDRIFARQNIDGDRGYWLLSLYHAGAADSVDWQKGNYSLLTRGGRVESDAGWGEQKQPTRMVAEGSVLVAGAEPRGTAIDVAPQGFAHPVYRSGFAVSFQVPLRPAVKLTLVEEPQPEFPAPEAESAPAETPEENAA